MARFTTILLLLTISAAVLGCAAEESVPPIVSDQPVAVAGADEPAKEPNEEQASEAIEPESAEMAEAHIELPRHSERILLLAPGGPLLLDVWLTIDGRPHDEGLAALIDRVLNAGDTDGNGHPTWAEWSENQEFLQGELANLKPIQERLVRDWVERFDENSDGQIQRIEAASWLGRDSGRSAAALYLRSSRSYFANAATNSRLWQLLDTNQDKLLSGDELTLASQRMLQLDTNDDRIIDLLELETLSDQLVDQSSQRSTFSGLSTRHAAIHLENRADAGNIDYLLGDLYSPRQQLGLGSFPARARLFGELDEDGDLTLSHQELESLLDIEPHAEFSLDFSSKPEDGKASVRLALLQHASEIDHVIQPTANRIALITSDTRVLLSGHDLTSSLLEGQTAQRHQIGLMVHDRGDSLFEALDKDANGRLGEREIAFAADRMGKCDTNDDGKLERDELFYSMTVAFLKSEPPGEQSFYVPSSATIPVQDSTAPSWFSHSDLNSDGDISKSEFFGSTAQFSMLDLNRDGFISNDEATIAKAPKKPSK